MKTKLLLVLIFTIVTFNVTAQSIGDTFIATNGIEYTITSDIGSLKVSATSYYGGSFDIDIPSTITYDDDVYYVTEVGDYAFYNNLIEQVTFGGYITTIGEYAFYGNHLANVTIPASVTSIGENAFQRSDLSNVTSLSENPATLPNNAFSSINNIHLHIPEGSEQAYIDAGWTGFQTVNFRFTVDGVVYEITEVNTNEVTVVDYVGTDDEVIIPERVEDNGGVIYLVNKIGDNAFYENGLISITLPQSIISIGESAFLYNNLESFTFPASVTSIGENAFISNDDLTEVTSESENPAYLPNIIFNNKGKITLTIPSGTAQNYIDQNWTGFGLVVEDSTLSTDNLSYKMINIYPNPVSENMSISLNEDLKQVNIYNAIGNKVYTNKTKELNISHLPSGIYLVKITTISGKTAVKKIIKK